MPPEGVKWKPHENILTFEEIIRLVKIMAALGIKNVKVTGGEPLLRKGASSFLNELKTINKIENVTLTTNGHLLGKYLDEANTMRFPLPNGINISLDALDGNRYKLITNSDNTNPQDILSVIDRLLEKQITIKINCVPVRSVNEEDILPLAELVNDKDITVRFIELMPIGCASALLCVSGTEVKAQIEKKFGVLTPLDSISGSRFIGSQFVGNQFVGNGPAVYYSLSGFKGRIGFINANTHNFCEICNRLRLTSEGFLKLCLSSDLGLDLRKLIRNGADDNEITSSIIETVNSKPRTHEFSKNHEGMSKVGG